MEIPVDDPQIRLEVLISSGRLVKPGRSFMYLREKVDSIANLFPVRPTISSVALETVGVLVRGGLSTISELAEFDLDKFKDRQGYGFRRKFGPKYKEIAYALQDVAKSRLGNKTE